MDVGVSYQVAGRFSVRGMWPPTRSCSRIFQKPKFGNDTMARRPIRSRFSSTTLRLPRRLQGLRQDHVIEGVVGIVDEVGVGVALHHREALGDAAVDALARQFDAAAVDAAASPAAAADRPRRSRRRAPSSRARPSRRPADDRRDNLAGCAVATPPSGSVCCCTVMLSRPASCCRPARLAGRLQEGAGDVEEIRARRAGRRRGRGRSRSPRTTPARSTAFSACTSARDSEVGNSQSLVNDTTQKRVWMPRNASASTPSWSAAMSK